MKYIMKLKRMSEQLENLSFDQGDPLSEAAKLELASELQGVINGGLTLAWKYGLSDISGIGLYPAVVTGGKLTGNELIRQQINSSRDVGILADDLRRLADKIEADKKPLRSNEEA